MGGTLSKVGGLIMTRSAGRGVAGGGVLVAVPGKGVAHGTVKSNVAVAPFWATARMVYVLLTRPLIVQMRVKEPLC